MSDLLCCAHPVLRLYLLIKLYIFCTIKTCFYLLFPPSTVALRFLAEFGTTRPLYLTACGSRPALLPTSLTTHDMAGAREGSETGDRRAGWMGRQLCCTVTVRTEYSKRGLKRKARREVRRKQCEPQIPASPLAHLPCQLKPFASFLTFHVRAFFGVNSLPSRSAAHFSCSCLVAKDRCLNVFRTGGPEAHSGPGWYESWPNLNIQI